MQVQTDLGGEKLRTALYPLMQYGFLHWLLPFLFLFVLFFAVLQKVAIFRTKEAEKDQTGKIIKPAKPNKPVNAVIAFVLAGMAVLPSALGRPYYFIGADPIAMIYDFLPEATVLLVAVLLMMTLLGVSGISIPSYLLGWIVFISAGLLLFTFLVGIFPFMFAPSLNFLREPAVQVGIFVMLLIGIIGYLVFREPKTRDPNQKSLLHELLYEDVK